MRATVVHSENRLESRDKHVHSENCSENHDENGRWVPDYSEKWNHRPYKRVNEAVPEAQYA
ncbi:hypothetical protein DY000_02058497 [Brassica cretica]|uniref:Uncharacterized protein n=1 Tax=Brassica cretica TaxID=69181 RepID=A0ABQ7AYR0_BRACR|nr:hypothetical protein DY000_02058497 [Brassica cretica]